MRELGDIGLCSAVNTKGIWISRRCTFFASASSVRASKFRLRDWLWFRVSAFGFPPPPERLASEPVKTPSPSPLTPPPPRPFSPPHPAARQLSDGRGAGADLPSFPPADRQLVHANLLAQLLLRQPQSPSQRGDVPWRRAITRAHRQGAKPVQQPHAVGRVPDRTVAVHAHHGGRKLHKQHPAVVQADRQGMSSGC